MLNKALTLVLATAAALVIVLPAYAQDAEPTDRPARDYTALELYYDRLNLAVESTLNRVGFGGDVLDAADDLIANLNEQGFDTSELVAARDNYAAALSSAGEDARAAQNVLNAAAGFTDGEVTDPQTARETLSETRTLLREAHFTLRDATFEFRSALRDIREQIRAEVES